MVVPMMLLCWILENEKVDGAEGRIEGNELQCVKVLILLGEETL